MSRIDAVLLLGFGGPQTAEEIRPFLDRVIAGRPMPTERYEAVVEHYRAIGGCSPYNRLSEEQAEALQRALRARGHNIPVAIGYRNVAPFVPETIARLYQQGARRLRAIPLAPQGGASSAGRYVAATQQAVAALGLPELFVEYAAPFFAEPAFIGAHAARVTAAAAQLGRAVSEVHLLFSAHSIPTAAPDKDLYVEQVQESSALVAQALGTTGWSIAYQSGSGTARQPWLEPDVCDAIRILSARGEAAVVVDPIAFLCDHVEVLYDLDIQAAQAARAAQIDFARAATVGADQGFIDALADGCIAP